MSQSLHQYGTGGPNLRQTAIWPGHAWFRAVPSFRGQSLIKQLAAGYICDHPIAALRIKPAWNSGAQQSMNGSICAWTGESQLRCGNLFCQPVGKGVIMQPVLMSKGGIERAYPDPA